MLAVDRRAEKILTRTFWATGGWKPDREWPAPEDRAHAETAGYMFPAELDFDHDELVAETRRLAAKHSLDEAARSFVASFSTRQRFLRPFLPSLVVATRLPDHTFEPESAAPRCTICGWTAKGSVDLNVLSFERHRWGGVRHLDLSFLYFSLGRLDSEGGAEPTALDDELFRSAVANLRALDPSTTLTRSETALSHVPSSMQERFVVLEQLSTVGLLQDPAHPGFLHGFIPNSERSLPGKRYLERGYPGEWWTAGAGLDEETLRQLFAWLV